MIEQSRGFDYVAIGFANDGRAMFAITCATVKDADRWAKNNQAYKWVIYNSNDYKLCPRPMQISFL